MNIDKFHFVALSEITSSKSHMLYQYLNSYWVVHPEKGIAFFDKGYGHPQCNSNESIAKRLCPEWGEIKFIEKVLVPLNISDYRE